MKLTHVLLYFNVNEEEGKETIYMAGSESDYEYLKNEAIEQSKFNESYYYQIETYITHEDIKCELAKSEIFFNGTEKEVYFHPVVNHYGLKI